MQNAMKQRLGDLRAAMKKFNLNGYIIPSQDAHQSEYVADVDLRRQFISGFTGSAGTALVTEDKAYLWTDGRYWNQAGKELDSSSWSLMRTGKEPDLFVWLSKNPSTFLKPGMDKFDLASEVFQQNAKIGIDPYLISAASFRDIKAELANSDNRFQLISVSPNLVDGIWTDQPSKPKGKIISLGVQYAGKSHVDKISEIRSTMQQNKCEYLIITMLDEIAWTLNLRGSDITYNPVFMSYLLISQSHVYLFVDTNKFSEAVQQHLSEIKNLVIYPYEQFVTIAPTLIEKGKQVWLDATQCNYAIYEQLANHSVLEKESPVKHAKSVKNEVELQGFRNSHLRDATALVRLFAWIEETIKQNENDPQLTEVGIANKAEEFRKQEKDFVDLSFATISSSGPNAAVIHYHPTPQTDRKVTTKEIFLLDSGAQYKDGTTDVTRTLHFGEPTQEEKECNTRVLKGHIAIDMVVFPEGMTGYKLDVLARSALWQAGLDFAHGTGHGVGHFLNVHEGPQGISFRKTSDDHPFKVGMTITNEPGFYLDGKFGIRIENVLLVKEVDTPYHFNNKKYFGFEHVTVVPIQTKLIEKSLLSPVEVDWINKYNKECHDKVAPLLEQVKDTHALNWLVENTKSI